MTQEYDPKDAESITRYARRLMGRTLGDFISEEELAGLQTVNRSKGSFGTALEELYFHISPGNAEGVPDFEQANLELKTCPTLYKGQLLVAKERLVLSMIDYMSLPEEEWETSTFIKKNRNLLLVFYLHEDDIPIRDLRIELVGRWSFPAEDLLIIRADWERIKAKVTEGKADELSEGDTLYLKACTKATSSKDRRPQPNSSRLAKPRAFSLPPSHINSIIERMRQRNAAAELANSVVKGPEELMERSFEQLVHEKFQPYLGRPVKDIASELGLDYNPSIKQYNALITKGILGVKEKAMEFERAGVIIRNVLLDSNGRLGESISFPTFDYNELDKEADWETSSVREMFEQRFFFVIYQKDCEGKRFLKDVMFWTIPPNDLLEIEKVWKKTKECIRQGRYDDLPRISENDVSHVRPHGRNKEDKVEAPDGSMVTKRSFWLNRKYVERQISLGRAQKNNAQSKLSPVESSSLILR